MQEEELVNKNSEYVVQETAMCRSILLRRHVGDEENGKSVQTTEGSLCYFDIWGC